MFDGPALDVGGGAKKDLFGGGITGPNGGYDGWKCERISGGRVA